MENKILWPGWETVRLIGRGSYGAVYEIERELYEGEKERAALKVISIPHNESEVNALRAEYQLDDKSITEVFKGQSTEIIKEYALMRKLSGHTNIVNCDEFRHVQQEDGLGWDVFIRMELLTPFTQTLGKTVEEEQVINVGMDLSRALILCRKYDIVHRDIKPQNIFVSETGDYKLGDFGIAKTMEHTSGATIIGTQNYMAPEVCMGKEYGHKADIYSLGLVLYWLLNERRLPFLPPAPKVPTPLDNDTALKRRRSGEPISAPKNGSAELKAIVLKACAYDPRDRYATADEMLVALNALSGEPVIAPPRPDNGADEDATIITGRRFAEKAGSGEDFTNNATVISAKPKKHMEEPVRKDRPKASREVDVPAARNAVRAKSKKKHQSRHMKPKKKKGITAVLAIIAVAACFAMALYVLPAMKDKEVEEDYAADKYSEAFIPNEEHTVNSDVETIISDEEHTANPNTEEVTSEEASPVRWNNETISAGIMYTVGLKTNGTVVAVGWNEYGQCDVSAWQDIVAISAGSGGGHTVGLKSDGTVVAVGWNYYGPCDVNAWQDVVAISAGGNFTVGLKSDGTVVAVGWNEYGQCDVSAWRDIVAVSAGGGHTVGLKSDGTVVAVGCNEWGQCDVSAWRDIVAVSAGGGHTVGLKSDGTVVAVGSNSHGQCDVSDWQDIVAVSARGGGHTVGLKSDGTVVAVGDNDDSECDVSGWTDIVAISAGCCHTVGLKSDGTVVAVGDNFSGECDVDDWTDIRLPQQLRSSGNVRPF